MICTAILLGFAGFSCSEFLEPKSQSEFIPVHVEQLNEMILSGLLEPYDNSYVSFTGGFLDILTDDVETTETIEEVFPGDAWYQNPNVVATFAMYTWQPNYSTYMQTNGYSNHNRIYLTVYRKLVYVNSALDYVDRVEGSDHLKKYVTAQALALRAFYNLHLVNMYGVPYNVQPDGPGIPLRTTGGKENRPMVRNTVKEVYNLVLSDLHQAIDLFSSLDSWYQFRQYRANLPMAMLLLSRAYLYMENWEQAAFYAEKLINEWSQFQIKDLNDLINSGYTNVHREAETTDNQNVRRTQKFYESFVGYDNSDVIWVYGSAVDVADITAYDMTSSNALSVSRLQNNSVYVCLNRASNSLINSFDPNDLRLRTYLVRSLFHEPDYSQNTFTASAVRYRAYGKLRIFDDGTGIANIQYNRFLPVRDSRTFGQTLRITEAWLILAEAQAMLGKANDAVQTLNAIWQKRFASGNIPASYYLGDAVELVRKERRRELCFESMRWFDLRRWGRPELRHTWHDVTYSNEHHVFVLEKDDPGYTLPLSHSLLEANPALLQVPLAAGGKERKPVSN